MNSGAGPPPHRGPRVAVILAAGRGERLRAGGIATPKPLLRIHGVSLAERVVRTVLRAAAIERIVVSVGWEAERVQAHFESIGRRCGIAMEFVRAADWHLGNGASALAAAPATGEEPFLLAMSDHLFAPELVSDLIAEAPGAGAVRLAVDRDKAAVFDLEDVTRVRLAEGRIAGIGKGLASWDAADTGVFYCSSGLYEALERAAAAGEHGVSGAVAALAADGRAIAVDVSGHWWRDVDTPSALEDAAERLLREAGRKRNDGPVARHLNRPLSRRLTRVVVRTPLSPNQVSMIVFALACMAAACMAAEPYWSLAAGGLLAQLSSVVDGCDGEVSRLRLEQTEFGGWLDAVLDRYADALILFALAWHAMHDNPAEICIAAGFASVLGTFLNSYTADRHDRLVRDGASAGIRIGRDVRMLAVAAGAVLDQPLAALWLVALSMNGEVVRRIFIYWRRSGTGRAAST